MHSWSKEDNMFVVNAVVERMKRMGGQVYLTFLNIEKNV